MSFIVGLCICFTIPFLFYKCCVKEAEIRRLMRDKTNLRHYLETAEQSRELWRKDFYQLKEKLDSVKEILKLEN